MNLDRQGAVDLMTASTTVELELCASSTVKEPEKPATAAAARLPRGSVISKYREAKIMLKLRVDCGVPPDMIAVTECCCCDSLRKMRIFVHGFRLRNKMSNFFLALGPFFGQEKCDRT